MVVMAPGTMAVALQAAMLEVVEKGEATAAAVAPRAGTRTPDHEAVETAGALKVVDAPVEAAEGEAAAASEREVAIQAAV